jgi:hypothetical protein
VSETVILELPDTIADRVRAIATQTHRPFEDVLIEWLTRAAADVPVDELPDSEVLALRDLQMSAAEQAELSDLLARQREGTISEDDRGRLDTLMRSYRQGLVRKARALKVAVDRGLQPPLS